MRRGLADRPSSDHAGSPTKRGGGAAKTSLRIRRARPEEARSVSELALRSKGHWGYPPEFLEACREELTLTPEDVERDLVFVGILDERIVGFYSVEGEPPRGELSHLYVDPAQIGTGSGTRLWRHALAVACRDGFKDLVIEADPYVEAFYLKMGAERIGERESGSIPGRMLPLLRVKLASRRPDTQSRGLPPPQASRSRRTTGGQDRVDLGDETATA